jgi:hypothetical protein
VAETPQERGRKFEKRFAEMFGAKIQVGSGNQWFAKLDVDAGSILWSLKSTSKKTLNLSRATLSEAIREAGKKGMIPGWAGEVDGETLVVLRADDLARLFEEGATLRTQRKADARRERAKIPVALRHAMEDSDDTDDG